MIRLLNNVNKNSKFLVYENIFFEFLHNKEWIKLLLQFVCIESYFNGILRNFKHTS